MKILKTSIIITDDDRDKKIDIWIGYNNLDKKDKDML